MAYTRPCVRAGPETGTGLREVQSRNPASDSAVCQLGIWDANPDEISRVRSWISSWNQGDSGYEP
jgi:hypothetical protein